MWGGESRHQTQPGKTYFENFQVSLNPLVFLIFSRFGFPSFPGPNFIETTGPPVPCTATEQTPIGMESSSWDSMGGTPTRERFAICKIGTARTKRTVPLLKLVAEGGFEPPTKGL